MYIFYCTIPDSDMYRPAGIYLINLFLLSNWANTVYFMFKTLI